MGRNVGVAVQLDFGGLDTPASNERAPGDGGADARGLADRRLSGGYLGATLLGAPC